MAVEITFKGLTGAENKMLVSESVSVAEALSRDGVSFDTADVLLNGAALTAAEAANTFLEEGDEVSCIAKKAKDGLR